MDQMTMLEQLAVDGDQLDRTVDYPFDDSDGRPAGTETAGEELPHNWLSEVFDRRERPKPFFVPRFSARRA